MAANETFVIERIVFGGDMSGTLKGIMDESLSPGITEIAASGSGEVDPTIVVQGTIIPVVTFTTVDVDAIMTSLGAGTNIVGKDCSGTVIHFSKIGADGLKSGGITVTIDDGMCIPLTMNGTVNAPATVNLQIIANFDGVNNPIEVASASPPVGLVGTEDLWTVGACNHNSNVLPQCQSISIDFGNGHVSEVQGGNVFSRFTWIANHAPVVTVSSSDCKTWLDLAGIDGLPITSSFKSQYFKFDNTTLILAATSAAEFNIPAGLIIPMSVAPTQGGAALVTYKIIARSVDGTTGA